MPKPKVKEDDNDKEITFTFRVPSYLNIAWARRMKMMPFKVSKQAYLMKLLEDDLVENTCITIDMLEKAKEAEQKK